MRLFKPDFRVLLRLLLVASLWAVCGVCPAQGQRVAGPAHVPHHVLAKRRPARGRQRRLGSAAAYAGLRVIAPLTSALPWTGIGPAPVLNGGMGGADHNDIVAGRVTGIAADPKNANTIYVSTAGGGAWKTADGGSTWAPLTDGAATLCTGSIAVAPSNPSVIYVGTGEANYSIDSMYGWGVLKSTDGGASWTLIEGNPGVGEFDRTAISKIVVHPTDPNTVYIAVTGCVDALAANGSQGIWKTTDGGASWTMLDVTLSTFSDYTDLIMDPNNPNVLYVAVGTPDGDPFGGVYKTTDGGATWAAAGDFGTGDGTGRIALAMSKANSQVIYAAVSDPGSFLTNTMGQLLYIKKSTDGGATWTALTNTPNYMGDQGWYDNALAVDPANANIVYAGGQVNYDAGGIQGILESRNGGNTWTDLTVDVNGNGPHTDHHAMAFDASGKLLDGNDGGLWRLANPTPGSILWNDINGNLGTIQFTGVALHPTNTGIAYGGSQDNGTEKYTGSLPWTQVDGGDGGFVRVDFNNPNTVYHTYSGNADGFLQRSDDGGTTWVSKTTGLNPNDYCNFYVPYVMDPANASRLLLGTDHLYETTNKGDSWGLIGSPGVNGFNADGLIIDGIAVKGNTVYCVASGIVNTLPEALLYATTNDGSSWQTHAVTGAGDHFSDVAVDPNNSQVIYVTRDVFNAEFDSGHVFRSADGGTTWADITGSLGDIPVNAVKVLANGTVYVGTDAGVFSTTNLGATWTPVGTGLPNARVVDLDYSPTTGVLAAGTHGRGMWVLGGTSNPVPAISTISPASATAGGASFTLTVNGSKFVSSSTVDWNGAALTTTYVSASQLTASVPAADIAIAGTASVTVVNPAPGGGTSNAVTFTINSNTSVPVLSSISPTSVNAAGPSFTLIAKGSSFAANSTVNWNGTALTTTYVSAIQLKASVPASLIASPGTAKITVSTPGAGTSASKTFTILQTTVKFTLSTLTRNSTTGVLTASVTLKNTGHLTASNLTLTGSTLNGVATSSALPISCGNLAAGATVTKTLTYPGSAGTSGQIVTQKVWGTFTGGSFSSFLKVTLP